MVTLIYRVHKMKHKLT